ncbi:MAG TPA: hypothetical protein VFH39_01100 [Candidatus Saccharimonadales bacterium]|nr:hypothetical protein [Candidatus Saccharimonadales bacterium]
MLPDEPTDEERLEELPEDNETPFSAADSELDDTERTSGDGAVTQHVDDTHPVTDTDVQREDVYENGLADAAEAGEQPQKGAVLGYKGMPNDMADDAAGIDPPAERIIEQDEDEQTTMEEV